MKYKRAETHLKLFVTCSFVVYEAYNFLGKMSNLFSDLESNDPEKVEDFKERLREQFNATRDSWICYGMYDYCLLTNSTNGLDVLAHMREPHEKHFFDKALDGLLRGNSKLQHLTMLGHIVRRKPIWLYKITNHQVFAEVLRLLKSETDIVLIVYALLIVNMILPLIPGVIVPHLKDLFHVFSKLAAMNSKTNNYQEAQIVHLQIALYTLFNRLYGMFPCNFISYLHQEFSSPEKSTIFCHTVKPMLDTVRVNALLITETAERELKPDRWKKIEAHDIIVECARLLASGNASYEPKPSVYEARPSVNYKTMLEGLKVTGNQTVAEYCKQLGKGGGSKFWSPGVHFLENSLKYETTPTRIPNTPVSLSFEASYDEEGCSPPEAAVEATPESTPSRSYREVATPPFHVTFANPSITSFSIEESETSIETSTETSLIQSPFKQKSSSQQLSRKFSKLIADRTEMDTDESKVELNVDSDSDIMVRGIVQGNLVPKFSSGGHSTGHKSSMGRNDRSKSRMKQRNANREPPVNLSSSLSLVTSNTSNSEDCEQARSGSPCSSGGLHMPDVRSVMRLFRRQYPCTQLYGTSAPSSGGIFYGNGAREHFEYLEEVKVRRAYSCPEMKKGTMNGKAHPYVSASPPTENTLLEEDEYADVDLVTEAESFSSDDNHSLKTVRRLEMPRYVDTETQTDETVPVHFPYEHIFLDIFPPLYPSNAVHDDHISVGSDSGSESFYERCNSPSKILSRHIEAAVVCHANLVNAHTGQQKRGVHPECKMLKDQLKLLSCQLQYEEYRREMHAERNRRLLGRTRRNRTLEEYNLALIDQVSILNDELKNRAVEADRLTLERDLQSLQEKRQLNYYKDKFLELQKQYEKVRSKCKKLQAELAGEKKINAANTKSIYEWNAKLVDVTNMLHMSQKEAKEVKTLREHVKMLQAEIMKAGEMIARYKRRIDKLQEVPAAAQVQYSIVNSACRRELDRVQKTANAQKSTIEALNAKINHLKRTYENKENTAEQQFGQFRLLQAKQEKEMKELRKRYEEAKRDICTLQAKVENLTFQLAHAKRVSKLSSSAVGRDHSSGPKWPTGIIGASAVAGSSKMAGPSKSVPVSSPIPAPVSIPTPAPVPPPEPEPEEPVELPVDNFVSIWKTVPKEKPPPPPDPQDEPADETLYENVSPCGFARHSLMTTVEEEECVETEDDSAEQMYAPCVSTRRMVESASTSQTYCRKHVRIADDPETVLFDDDGLMTPSLDRRLPGPSTTTTPPTPAKTCLKRRMECAESGTLIPFQQRQPPSGARKQE